MTLDMSRLTPVIGIKAKNQDVVLDGKLFENCEFKNCTFVWNGGGSVMKNCKISPNRQFRTDSLGISSTVDLLKDFGFLSDEFAGSWQRHPKGYFKGLK